MTHLKSAFGLGLLWRGSRSSGEQHGHPGAHLQPVSMGTCGNSPNPCATAPSWSHCRYGGCLGNRINRTQCLSARGYSMRKKEKANSQPLCLVRLREWVASGTEWGTDLGWSANELVVDILSLGCTCGLWMESVRRQLDPSMEISGKHNEPEVPMEEQRPRGWSREWKAGVASFWAPGCEFGRRSNHP